MTHITLFGKEITDFIRREKERLVPHSKIPGMENCFQSEPLCDFQRDISKMGFIGATFCKSIYGWSLRYDSGLQDFGLIYSARCKEVDGTYEDCLRMAHKWQAEDPEHRYVTTRESEYTQLAA